MVSNIYRNRTGRKCVYNITAIDNIPSIIENGILCYEKAAKLTHCSIALGTVQERRARIIIPNCLSLHCYANLYLDYNNPMLYKRKDMAEELCILAIDVSILDNPECILTDRNAAADLVKFYPASEGVKMLDFDLIFAQYWNHENPYEYSNHKAIKCAEVLIPDSVSYDYIVGAYVVSDKAEKAILSAGFDKRTVIQPKVFYR